MVEENVPDWAIREACERGGVDDHPTWKIRDVRAYARDDNGHGWARMTMLAASLIAKHEKEPVDPLYEALKAVVELGRYDTREQTQLLRGELAERGLEIRPISEGGKLAIGEEG